MSVNCNFTFHIIDHDDYVICTFSFHILKPDDCKL